MGYIYIIIRILLDLGSEFWEHSRNTASTNKVLTFNFARLYFCTFHRIFRYYLAKMSTSENRYVGYM